MESYEYKPKPSERVIMLADCQSFYASIEKAAHPEYADLPLVVAGDPARRSGIILAACPIAKKYGVTTAETLGEALGKCPDLVIMKPHMQEYINVSLQITEILRTFTDLVEPYSIDEQHIDVTGSLGLFGDPFQIAKNIQQLVMERTGIYTRVGISESKVVSKMACDNFAKKNKTGIHHLPHSEVPKQLWPLPIHQMFMVGSRMTRHFKRLGIHTIGQLAQASLPMLRQKWGINGEVLWRIANGIDNSPVTPTTHEQQKGIGHQMTLPRDYATLEEIEVVLLELTELVCQRCRKKGYMGQVVSVNCRGASFERASGFNRQMKLPDPTHLTDEVYAAATSLLRQHWDGQPIRRIGVSLSELASDQEYQLTLFDRHKKMELEQAIDQIKLKYGNTAILRAVSLTSAGQAKDRAKKIGGHYK